MLTSTNRIVAVAAAALVVASVCRAESTEPEGDLVQASLLADVDAVAPGGTLTLGVRLKMKPHWHTYWVNPGEAGDATKITLSGPPGWKFGEIQWPLPTKIDAPGGITYGYEDEVLLTVPVTVSAGDPAGGEAVINADVSWLVCKEECIKGGAKLTITLPVGASLGQPAHRELFETWRARLPVTLEDAVTGGAVDRIEQIGAAKGNPAPELFVAWLVEPRKVEWFPVSTRAVAIDDVTMRTNEHGTTIRFKPTVYKPDGVPDGRVDSVLVFEDAGGRRVGVAVPITVPVPATK